MACLRSLAALTLLGVVLCAALSPTHAPVSHRWFVEGPIPAHCSLVSEHRFMYLSGRFFQAVSARPIRRYITLL